MSRFPRYLRRQLEVEDAARVEAIVRQVEPVTEQNSVAAGATAAGDARRLRGLPVVARGVSGSTVETDPVRALLTKESRRRG